MMQCVGAGKVCAKRRFCTRQSLLSGTSPTNKINDQAVLETLMKGRCKPRKDFILGHIRRKREKRNLTGFVDCGVCVESSSGELYAGFYILLLLF